MDIEAARAVVDHTPLTPAEEADLRHQARIRSTHYSTRIEGNRLTLSEAQQVIEGKKGKFHGRERDVREVQNYWNALLKVEQWARQKKPLTEVLMQQLHGLVEKGSRAKSKKHTLSGRTECYTGQHVRRSCLYAAGSRRCSRSYHRHDQLGCPG
jgi:Fic family protein